MCIRDSSQVELMLTRKLGDVGKKIHSGRSRNDQVLVDLKLFTRAELKEVAEEVEQLFHVLISQSNTYKDVLMQMCIRDRSGPYSRGRVGRNGIFSH